MDIRTLDLETSDLGALDLGKREVRKIPMESVASKNKKQARRDGITNDLILRESF